MRHVDGKFIADSSNEYPTPINLFKHLNDIFNFTVDVASTVENAKCDKFYTIEDNGLAQDWGGEKVWCNPPYDRSIKFWVEKCYLESLKPKTLVVALLPAKTDPPWFHEYIKSKAVVLFFRGRLKFEGQKAPAPYGSMLVIWGLLNYEK